MTRTLLAGLAAGALLAGCGGSQTTQTAKGGSNGASTGQPAQQPAAPVAQSTPSPPPAAGAPLDTDAEYDKVQR